MKLAAVIAWCVLSIPIGIVWLAHELRGSLERLRARRRRAARRGYLDLRGPR